MARQMTEKAADRPMPAAAPKIVARIVACCILVFLLAACAEVDAPAPAVPVDDSPQAALEAKLKDQFGSAFVKMDITEVEGVGQWTVDVVVLFDRSDVEHWRRVGIRRGAGLFKLAMAARIKRNYRELAFKQAAFTGFDAVYNSALPVAKATMDIRMLLVDGFGHRREGTAFKTEMIHAIGSRVNWWEGRQTIDPDRLWKVLVKVEGLW